MNTKFIDAIMLYLARNGIRVSEIGEDRYLVIGQVTMEIMPADGVREFALSYLAG